MELSKKELIILISALGSHAACLVEDRYSQDWDAANECRELAIKLQKELDGRS